MWLRRREQVYLVRLECNDLHQVNTWDRQMEKEWLDSWLKGDQVCFRFVWSPSTSCPASNRPSPGFGREASNQQETTSSQFSSAIKLWTTNPSSVLNQLAEIWDNFSAVWFCVKFLQRQIVQFRSDKNYVKSSATTIWQIFDGFLILAASIQFPHFQGIHELSLHSQFVVELPTGDFGVGTTIILWFPLFLQIVDEMLHLSYDLRIVSYVSLVAVLISNCRMCLWWL